MYTVAELIEYLKEIPSDYEIYVCGREGISKSIWTAEVSSENKDVVFFVQI